MCLCASTSHADLFREVCASYARQVAYFTDSCQVLYICAFTGALYVVAVCYPSLRSIVQIVPLRPARLAWQCVCFLGITACRTTLRSVSDRHTQRWDLRLASCSGWQYTETMQGSCRLWLVQVAEYITECSQTHPEWKSTKPVKPRFA